MEPPNNLLACPFCGSNEVSESSGRNGDNTPFYYVECETCAGMGPGHNKPRLAVEAWNVRAGAGRALQDSGGKQLCSTDWLDALATSFAAESGKTRELEDHCVHEEDRKRARDRSCILMDIASALRSASNQQLGGNPK